MKRCITLCGPSRELPQKNQSIHVEIQNKGFFWNVLELFRLFLRCSWLVLGLFRLFLACSWVVQVVLGLFRGVPSFSNDVLLLWYQPLSNPRLFVYVEVERVW